MFHTWMVVEKNVQNKWILALIGRFHKGSFSLAFLEDQTRKLWQVEGDLSITPMDNMFLIFKFTQ